MTALYQLLLYKLLPIPSTFSSVLLSSPLLSSPLLSSPLLSLLSYLTVHIHSVIGKTYNILTLKVKNTDCFNNGNCFESQNLSIKMNTLSSCLMAAVSFQRDTYILFRNERALYESDSHNHQLMELCSDLLLKFAHLLHTKFGENWENSLGLKSKIQTCTTNCL